MTQPETLVYRAIAKWVTEHGGVCYKLHGSSFSIAGLPDLLIFIDGRTLLVETKTKGKKPEPIQEARIDEINQHGGTAFHADSLAMFIEKYDRIHP